MEQKYCITIARQFGSLGRQIGKQLAKELISPTTTENCLNTLQNPWDFRFLHSPILTIRCRYIPENAVPLGNQFLCHPEQAV